MASYKDVQEYTRTQFGWVAQSCWIAHVKELIGAPLRPSKRGKAERAKPCPLNKRQQVEEAMRAVGLV